MGSSMLHTHVFHVMEIQSCRCGMRRARPFAAQRACPTFAFLDEALVPALLEVSEPGPSATLGRKLARSLRAVERDEERRGGRK